MPDVEVLNTSDLAEGSLKKVMAGGREILLATVQGRVYATDLHCPHFGADLSGGTLEDAILTCPLHHSQFDVRDGHVVRWTDLKGIVLTLASKVRPPRPLKCYPVRIGEDRVYVSVP